MKVKILKSTQTDKKLETMINNFVEKLADHQIVSITVQHETHRHYVEYATIVHKG